MDAAVFFRTIQPGQRFRLVDPTGMSVVPGPDDVLTVGELQDDEECGVVRLFTYEHGLVGAFDPAEMQRAGMRFEILES